MGMTRGGNKHSLERRLGTQTVINVGSAHSSWCRLRADSIQRWSGKETVTPLVSPLRDDRVCTASRENHKKGFGERISKQ